MKGEILIKNESSGEEVITEFLFKKDDVRSCYRTKHGIAIYLFGQGEYTLEQDAELYEQLKVALNG